MPGGNSCVDEINNFQRKNFIELSFDSCADSELDP